MDVSAAIKGRRSVRSYKDQAVENDKIEKVLEAGRLSPSANNRQEWKFIVVKNAETKKKLASAVREHYKKYPEALSMQASGNSVPPTVENHS